jgi:signal peptidase I
MMTATVEAKRQSRGHLEALLIITAVLLFFGARIFLFQPFNIPSGAMEETLRVGDYLFVSKFSYGFSHYSLPFSPPLFSGRIWSAEPQRGDVVVFRLPKNDSIDYIKRVVGLPGDRIQMINGLLHINGEPVKRQRIEDIVETSDYGRSETITRWQETLPNAVTYVTLERAVHNLENTPVFEVPAGHYFMMGDNRDNSSDSRDPGSGVGYVPLENLIGRAQVIFFSIRDGGPSSEPQDWPERIRWERVFKVVR